jgi:hypothetical protein
MALPQRLQLQAALHWLLRQHFGLSLNFNPLHTDESKFCLLFPKAYGPCFKTSVALFLQTWSGQQLAIMRLKLIDYSRSCLKSQHIPWLFEEVANAENLRLLLNCEQRQSEGNKSHRFLALHQLLQLRTFLNTLDQKLKQSLLMLTDAWCEEQWASHFQIMRLVRRELFIKMLCLKLLLLSKLNFSFCIHQPLLL